MRHIYVAGGRQRKRVLMRDEEWFMYEKALVVEFDTETKQSSVRVGYEGPPDAHGDDLSILFKTGTLDGNKLYLCTSTELLVYEIPAFERAGYISLPCFNDLHHVRPRSNGNLLVVNTGLDMVLEITQQGEVRREWDVLGGDPWRRFSKEIDYRKVATTKPHQSHPNFVFELGEEIWVTRCFQKDAVCLTHPGRRIDIGIERVHDGHLFGDSIYFTTVDGNLVIVERDSLQIQRIIDLKTIDNFDRALLGWCRGLLIVDESRVWVGFTRVRKTRFQENVNWVKHVFHDTEKPTHIALYDIEKMRCLQEIDLEPSGLNIVFSIFPAGL
jgi:hypothetical protein